jgi:hypothetical protein
MSDQDVLRFLNERRPLPPDSEWRLTDRGDGFWSGCAFDISGEQARPYVGALTVVLPDGSLVLLPGSLGNHLREAVELLKEQVMAGSYSPEAFAEDLRHRWPAPH